MSLPYSLALRWWILGDCPDRLNTYAPPGYGPGCVALVHGGTTDGEPPQGWFEWLLEHAGLNDVVKDTLCVQYVDAFSWTAYWDPTGQATPPTPRCGWPVDPNVEQQDV